MVINKSDVLALQAQLIPCTFANHALREAFKWHLHGVKASSTDEEIDNNI